jgi:hypothetical protein
MEKDEIFFSQVQAPIESETVEEDIVKFQRTWVFWENYEAKSGEKLNYSSSLKEIMTFNDIISFWQFWNSYPGSNPAYIFYNGDRLR